MVQRKGWYFVDDPGLGRVRKVFVSTRQQAPIVVNNRDMHRDVHQIAASSLPFPRHSSFPHHIDYQQSNFPFHWRVTQGSCDAYRAAQLSSASARGAIAAFASSTSSAIAPST
jgi:hypothetical protein